MANDYRVRIGFNYVRWDYIAVDTSAPSVAVKTVHTPETADLHFRGYSATDKTTYPYWVFDYDNVSTIPEELYAYQSGNFTRYGDVTSLMHERDNQSVVMHYGDELSLKFDYAEPESGMERSFVLSGAVWYKSAKEQFGRTVDPLPFVGMDSYPYDDPDAFPESAYAQEWNTRNYSSRGGSGNTIRASYSTAEVEGSNYVGGLVGQLKDKYIYDSYAAGSVSGADSVGGLAGSNEGSGKVINSYACGTVTGVTNVGGLVGLNNGTVTSSFYDQYTTGQSDIGKGDPKTTAQMKAKATFTDANWDFSTMPIWTIDPNDQGSNTDRVSYPYFPWQTGRMDYAPPVFTDSYPDVMNIGSSALDLKMKTDEAATAWYVVLPRDADKPTALQIKAGTDASGNSPVTKGSLSLSAQTVATAHVTGLTSNTDYDIYVVSEDLVGNLQPDVNVVKITAHTANPTYSVMYDGNGSTEGNAPEDSNAYHQGDTVAVLGNTGSLAKSGYSFVGWNTKADGTGTDFAAGATFLMGSSNETQYAKWAMNVPGVPTINMPNAEDGQIRLSWSTVAGAAYYKLYQSTASGSYGTEIATVSGSTYTITGLSNGTVYYYVIKATNAAGDSIASNEVTATPQVAAPGAPVIQAASAGDEHVNITWNSVSGAIGYKVYIGTASGTYTEPAATVAGSVYSYAATGLTNGTTYYFVVKAINPGGDSPNSSEVSAMPLTVPGAPTNVSASAGNGQTTITFTAPSDNGGSPITGYVVTSSPGNITATGTGTTITVTGLTNGTTYTFTVKALNSVGNGADSTASNAVTPYRPSSGGSSGGSTSTTPAQPTETGVNVLVNGKAENAGTAITTEEGGRTFTTITVDEAKLEQRLAGEGNNAVVTIPVNTQADVVVGELNGRMVRNMEDKMATLEVRTEIASYSLPAQQLNIEAIAAQLGQNVELKDVKVQIEIEKSSNKTVQVVGNAAQKGEFTIVAPPMDFSVKCSSGGKTIEISSFNVYVERMIAIPDGVDPNKITTGIVVEPDGTVRHVPTRITSIDGKYYAVISSLTNSTYSVVWHPLEFKDAANHWAKEAINDMGSRIIISGVGNDLYEPDRDITRAEFAAIVVRALGLKPGTGSNPFSDVSSSEWYCEYIRTASQYGIISGYGNGKFGPMDKITREQAMIMIARAMKITGLEAGPAADDIDALLAGFGDSAQVAACAKQSIAACVKMGIVSGKSGGLLVPKDEITRAEVAVIVKRLLQKSNLI